MKTDVAIAAGGGGHAAPPLTLHRLTDPRYLCRVRDTLRDLASDDSKHPRFPGPNPVSLDTSHFPKLAGEPYYVCEKTDGVRYLMLCCTLEAPEALRGRRATVNVCALLDRALNAYLLPVGHLPRAAYQGSLLDGELAYNKRAGRWEYLVFDAVCVSGVPVLNGTLKDRMDAVHAVLRVYSARESNYDPVALRAKTFVSGSNIDEFERKLDELQETYDVDGIILTPALPPVTYGRHHGMFKLKFGSRHTVDFLVGQDGRSISVFDAGTHVQVGSLLTPAPPGSIAECALASPDTTIWTVVTLRTDKATANDMYTYQKTMLNMRENLGLEHVKRILKKT